MLSASREWLHRVDCRPSPDASRTPRMLRYRTLRQTDSGVILQHVHNRLPRNETAREENDGRQENCDEPCHIGGAVAIGRGKGLVTFISRILTLYLKSL